MLVMCSHTGEPGAVTGALGPVAEHVLTQVACPVVFVPPERGQSAWDLQQVLLPHDGTPTTSVAMRPAAEIALRAEAELLVVHVVAPGERAPSEPGSMPAPRYVDQRHYEMPDWATEFLDRLAAVSPFDREKLRFHYGRGDPGTEILRAAEEGGADLILLGWRGLLELERAHVVKEVLRGASCPVMVLRAPPGG
jgi:nucleotide-binding universal stress UspA family protein